MDKEKMERFDALIAEAIAKIREAQDLIADFTHRKSMMLSICPEYSHITIYYDGSENASYWPSFDDSIKDAVRIIEKRRAGDGK